MSVTTLPLVMMRRKSSLNLTHKPNYFPCKLCNKTFTWKNSLQTHVSNIHGESRGPFPCPLCGKLSKNKKSLTTHLHDFHRKWSTQDRRRTKQRLHFVSLQTRHLYDTQWNCRSGRRIEISSPCHVYFHNN
jgi:uncharacterized C2H2 Zn-finger protein